MEAQGGDLTVWMMAHYKQGWRPQKIALFLSAVMGIPVSVSTIRSWMRDRIPDWEEEKANG